MILFYYLSFIYWKIIKKLIIYKLLTNHRKTLFLFIILSDYNFPSLKFSILGYRLITSILLLKSIIMLI